MSDTPPAPDVPAQAGPGLIGVPEGYTTFTWQGPQRPQYRDGDQFMGANRTPAEIANLQRALASVHLLQGAFRIGVWDDETAAAFEGLLSYANRLGTNWQRALEQMRQNGGIGEVDENGNVVGLGGAGGSGGLPITISDPATLRTTFRETAAAMRGQGFSDAEYDAMVAAYQAVERRAQERQYDLAQGAVGDERYEVVNPPSPQAWAEEEVRRRDPSGVMSRDVLDRMDQFYALIQAGAPVQPG